MRITESLSLFLSPNKNSKSFRTSQYPRSYQNSDVKAKINSIRAYYKLLQAPSDSPKPIRNSRSPVKIRRTTRVPFAFRSHSSLKLLKEENPHRVPRPLRSVSRRSRAGTKSCDRFSKELKEPNLLELIQVTSAK